MARKKRKILTPEQAIKAKCKECSCGQKAEVEFCPILDCPLWPYRNGVDKKEIPMDEESRNLWDSDIELEE